MLFVRSKNFRKKNNWLKIVLIASFTTLLKRVKKSKTWSLFFYFKQVKKINSLPGFKLVKNLRVTLEQVKNSFRGNSVTYGAPCQDIGHFAFWCHHVTFRTPCHASGQLVIYRERYGFERAFFNLRRFFTFLLILRLPWEPAIQPQS